MSDSLALSIPTSDNTEGLSPEDDVFDPQAFMRCLQMIADRHGYVLRQSADTVLITDITDYASDRTHDFGTDDGETSDDEEIRDKTDDSGPDALPDTPRSNRADDIPACDGADTPKSHRTDDVPACDGADTPRSDRTNDYSDDDGTPSEFFFSDNESTAETPLDQAQTDI